MIVREFNTIEEVQSRRSIWDTLFAETTCSTFFHTFDWFAAYWRHYGRGQQLRVLLVEKNAQPIGLVPLVIRQETTRVGPVRVLTYPLHDWGSFYSPLGSNVAAVLRAALTHIRHTPRTWDLVDLRWIDPALDQAATRQSLCAAGLPADEQRWSESAIIETAGGWQEYWRSRSSDWRSNLRRCQRKLAASGPVRYERYRSAPTDEPDPRWDLYDASVAVAGRSWQSTATDGTTLSHATIREFLRDAHLAAAHTHSIDMNLLYVSDQPVAFAYNYYHDGWVYGLRTGYDPQRSRDGAGHALLEFMIRDSFERGDRMIDLGAGYLHTKRYWHTSLRPSHRCTYFPATAPRAQVLRLKRWLARQLDAKRQQTRSSLPGQERT